MNKFRSLLFVLAAGTFFLTTQAQNPIIRTMYTADPAPIVHRDTLFVFVGHDEDDAPSNTFLMREYRLFSTVDMVNWTDHGAALRTSEIGWSAGDASAAQVVERNGKFYFYVSTQNSTPGAGGVSVGVLVADNIRGPYRDVLGKALVTNQMTSSARHSWDDLDPTVFIDDDGQAYLFWGNNACYWALLNEDMISLGGPINVLDVRDRSIFGPDFEEAPWVYKRGGLYYMVYASGLPESIHYATAPKPQGPWSYRGVVMPRQGGSGTNHPGMIDYRGRSYFFYHNDFLPGGHGHRRSVAVEEFTYNADGTIPQMTMTDGIEKGIARLDPYRRTEAETIAWAEGVKTGGEGSGVYLTSIHNGDWVKVRDVDFGEKGAATFTARTSSRYLGGEIELRLDAPDGPVIGTLRAPYTGEWENWRLGTTEISGATGVHDLYFVFKGTNPPELFRFDHWVFTEKSIRVTDNVPYREGGSRSWVLDMAEPVDSGGELRPVVVLIHGGGWRAGSKQERPFRSMLLHYANQGYVTVSLDYRLDGEAPFPACISDVKCAVRWLKANAAELKIDPERIGAYGHSAGGHLAVMLAVSSDNKELEGDGPWQEYTSAITCAVGGASSTQRHPPKRFWEPQYEACWPIYYLSADRPPLLFLQGEADQTVDPAIVKDYVEKAKAVGADVEYIGVPGLGHDVSYTLALDITQPAMDKFFAKHLK